MLFADYKWIAPFGRPIDLNCVIRHAPPFCAHKLNSFGHWLPVFIDRDFCFLATQVRERLCCCAAHHCDNYIRSFGFPDRSDFEVSLTAGGVGIELAQTQCTCAIRFGPRFSMTLDQIYQQAWRRLDHAARMGSADAFNSLQAASIGLDGSPNARTIAVRTASEHENRLTFHTDRRSPKVAELTRIPRIALVGFDPKLHTQIRMFGECRVVESTPARLTAWKGSPDHDLIQYRTRVAPGLPVNHPSDAFGDVHTRVGAEEGFVHFCIVEVSPDRIDWLDLSLADNPIRAQFVRKDGSWRSSWVAP